MTIQEPLNPIAFTDNLYRILSVLRNAKETGTERLSALDIAATLTNNYGLRMHWRSVNALLLKESQFVDRKKKSGKWFFSILQTGLERIVLPPTSICFVDPSKAVQAVVTLHDLLGNCQGVARVCDPYLDDVTLQHLDACR